jgi:uncharacterized membrane protein
MRRHEIHRAGTVGERAADSVAAAMGSWKFIIAQSVIVVVWMACNVVGFVRHWDIYPFILLNLLFSTQAAYAAPIIMMSQNRQAQRDRLRDDLEASEVEDLTATTKEIHRINLAQTQMLTLLHEILQQQRGGQ